jgi:hypothetical protein
MRARCRISPPGSRLPHDEIPLALVRRRRSLGDESIPLAFLTLGEDSSGGQV